MILKISRTHAFGLLFALTAFVSLSTLAGAQNSTSVPFKISIDGETLTEQSSRSKLYGVDIQLKFDGLGCASNSCR
jgi:hypothetical protein